MKEMKYISPTSLKQWKEDRNKFYGLYMADTKVGQEAQSQAMSIGSAFDSRVKGWLAARLKSQPALEVEMFEYQFENSVELQNRDWARRESESLFNHYQQLGAAIYLLKELERSPTEPRFEHKLESEVVYKGREVRFLGKPDVFYSTHDGIPVEFDWKVNGYCSNSNTSPMKGYFKILPGGKSHPDMYTKKIGDGNIISDTFTLDQVNKDWGRQLAIYSWLCGVPVDGQVITVIHQLCGNPVIKPIRVAEHRCLINREFQIQEFNDAADMWQAVKNGHVFTDLPLADSLARCKMLDEIHSAPKVLVDR